jgi:DNA replication licensing factor MCM3
MSTDDDSDDDDDDDGGDGAFRPNTGRRSTPRTPGRSTRKSTNGVNGLSTTNGNAGAGAADEQEDDDDELYTSTPNRQRTQTSRANGTQGSQFSLASSQPASQLLQDDSQSQQPPSEAESEEAEATISEPRLRVFQTALGQLINGPLFANDAADVEPLVSAVNSRLRSGDERFEETEAVRALEELNERNKIMFTGGIVYRL